jgi:hypothetical protein
MHHYTAFSGAPNNGTSVETMPAARWYAHLIAVKALPLTRMGPVCYPLQSLIDDDLVHCEKIGIRSVEAQGLPYPPNILCLQRIILRLTLHMSPHQQLLLGLSIGGQRQGWSADKTV